MTHAMTASSNSNWKGWARERLISLADQKRQVLTMRKPLRPTKQTQMMAIHQASTGYAVAKMDGGGEQAGSGRNGHADKVFAVGPAGIARLGVVADVEAGQARDSADEKQESR